MMDYKAEAHTLVAIARAAGSLCATDAYEVTEAALRRAAEEAEVRAFGDRKEMQAEIERLTRERDGARRFGEGAAEKYNASLREISCV